MNVSRFQRAAIIGVALALLTGPAAAGAAAQTFGIGPRLVFVTGADSPLQDPANPSTTRLTGGFLRLRTSSHVGLEVSMDFRTATNVENTLRVKTTPIQGSVLIYPFRTVIAPYAVGGIGWYKQRYEALDAGTTAATADNNKFGYHAGFGGELMLGRHASIFVDYRYTFVNVADLGSLASSAFGLTSLMGLLSTLNTAANSSPQAPTVSHLGSTWTTGVTIYF